MSEIEEAKLPLLPAKTESLPYRYFKGVHAECELNW